MGDKSAVAGLQDATRDPSPFVRDQAKKALAQLSAAPSPGKSGGARITVAVGFQGGKSGQWNDIVRGALTRELGKLPDVTVAAGNPATKPNTYLVDGTIQRAAARSSAI
jgi:hypothetical protein